VVEIGVVVGDGSPTSELVDDKTRMPTVGDPGEHSESRKTQALSETGHEALKSRCLQPDPGARKQ
jgi:hypothetical protein